MLKKYLLLLILNSCHPQIKSPHATKSIVVSEQSKRIIPQIDNFCPGMIHVQGSYCTNLIQNCLEWIDKKRCKSFSHEPKCIGEVKELNFCIDKEEAHNSENLPLTNITWNQANKLCNNWGKRLCGEKEFVKACQGPNNFPYPYGFNRIFGMCNIDKKAYIKNDKLINESVSIKEYSGCVSEYGVHNLIGNVDEWVKSDGNTTYQSVLRGGFWSYAIRGRCDFNVRTTEHFEEYANTQTGFRCCKNIND